MKTSLYAMVDIWNELKKYEGIARAIERLSAEEADNLYISCKNHIQKALIGSL